MIKSGTKLQQDSLAEWPKEGLEQVKQCPVCEATERKILYRNLTDRVFFCAPGKWTLYQCTLCGSAYLDPRPSRETVHMAYSVYYTHTPFGCPSVDSISGWRRLQRSLANGYRNFRYGTQEQPANPLGIFLAHLFPTKKALLDREFRELPRPFAGGRVLEVGFGNGAFLERARAAGWQVVGVDPDPVVVANARGRGLNVRQGGIEAIADEQNAFDIITMSHVIEHVHDPVATIEIAYQLLKPGGILWLETPNIMSTGHRMFESSWRGLEVPRHLTLFNWQSMSKVLHKLGFANIEKRRYGLSSSIFAASYRIKTGLNPYAQKPIPSRVRIAAFFAEILASINPNRAEFITVQARKPGRSET